jgi:hypothetical protein
MTSFTGLSNVTREFVGLIGYIVLASMASSLMGAPASDHRLAIAAAGQVPLSFERASSGNTRWMARGSGYRLAVGAADVEVGLNDEKLRIQFLGADAKAVSSGLDALPGKVNYFVGRDPKGWLRDVPTYGRVRYKDVYPGVDVVWYGQQGHLEYDLELQPGADPDKIAMRFAGARKLSLDPSGDLRVEMAGGSLSVKLPEVYQEGTGGRLRITSGYQLRPGNEVGFRLAAYDKAQPLVIDPTLVYATYFGSSYPTVNAVAVDASGNIYMGGYTNQSFMPAVNDVQAGNLGQTNAFIAKFDPTGTTILYSTYLGGSQYDYLYQIAVDSTSGNLVGVGFTYSPDFPLVNAVQPAFGATASGFGFRLNAAGNGLVYSTYLGGSGYASGNAVALDGSSNAYFAGNATAFQTTPGAVNNCCTFVEKLSATGSEVYGALIGADLGLALAVDSLGAAYVTGYSTASSFPNSPPGARTSNAGGGDAFVAKLSPDATSLTWATFLGGSGSDFADAIALGAGNMVYVGGQTSSSNLPVTAGAVQRTYGGGTDAFVASLSADGSSFGWVTYLGGGKFDTLTSLAVGSGGLIVAGDTQSRDFPIAGAVQPAFPGSPYAFLKSTHSGVSFASADLGLSSAYGGIILPDPSTAGTIVIDTGQGIFRSTNDGASWTSVEPNSIGSTARSLSNPSVLYTADGCSLYKSTDGGQTWSATYTNCTSNTPDAYVVAISPTDPNTVLLFSGNTEYISTDGGMTFPQSITTPFSFSAYGSPIVSSPDGSLYAVAGYAGLYKSTDVGMTWTQLGNGAPTYLAAFAVSTSSPSTLYASDGNNVYQSTNAGAFWTATAPETAVSYVAVDPTHPLTVYGASTQSAAILASTDGGVTWAPTGAMLDSEYIEGLALSPLNSGELYVSGYVPQTGFVAKLTTDGTTLTWSTFFGPYDYAQIGGASPAPSGNVWVAGSVDSESLPLTSNARNRNTYAPGSAFLAEIADATASCAYTINPTTQYSYSAGRLAFAVTAPSGCAWAATPSDSWIHLIRTTGTGSGTIPMAVDGNTTASARNGTVTVNGQVYTIVQPPSSCTYGLTYPSLSSAGGTASISVAAPTGCQWDVELGNSDPALVTSSSAGTGNGTVAVSVPPNGGVENLSYNVQIGGSSSSISQQSACFYSFPNGTAVFIPADSLSYSIQTNTNLNGCQWNAYSDSPSWLTLNNAFSSGTGMFSYTVTPNDTGFDRTANIFIGSQQLTLTQRFTSAEFADTPPSATFFDAANLMLLAGVTDGCVQSSGPSTGLFCPNNNVTRQEMAAFIVRAVTGTLMPAIYNPVPYFTDVPPTNPFFPHIQKLEELGITSGCATGLFCPTDDIPRWEMAIFMVRARLMLYGATFTTATTPYFADVPIDVEGNGQPFPFIQRAYEENITNGCGTNPLVYCPDELVTRGQMASFIMRGLFNETTILGPTAPLLTAVTPNAMAATLGTQITVTITGVNTSFQTGDTVTVPSGMLAVSNVMVNSATSISATLTANSTIVDGPQALVVTTGGQNLTLPLAIKVGTYSSTSTLVPSTTVSPASTALAPTIGNGVNTAAETNQVGTVPSPPTSVSAIHFDAQATITFTPGYDGGAPILYYTVTSNPGKITAKSATSSIFSIPVFGLVNGQSYTFTVTATNAIGTSAPSSASNVFVPENLNPTNDWYHASWTKREAVAITGSTAGAQANYQVKVVLPYVPGMNSHFNDVRFTNSDGTTLLNYWMESEIDNCTATFWVNVPSIPAFPNTITIYAYHGNSSAISLSNGPSTFPFFDSFGDGTTPGAWNWTYNTIGEHGIINNGELIEPLTDQTGDGGARSGLVILNPADGSVTRHFTIPSTCLEAAPAIDTSGFIHVYSCAGAGKGFLAKIDPNNGVVATYPINTTIDWEAVPYYPADNIVLVGVAGTGIVAVNASDYSTVWTNTGVNTGPGETIEAGPPLIVGSYVYWQDFTGELFKIAVSDGVTVASTTAVQDSSELSGVTSYANMIYDPVNNWIYLTNSTGHTAFAIDASNLSVVWSKTLDTAGWNFFRGSAYHNNVLYVTDREESAPYLSKVYALDTQNSGNILWTNTIALDNGAEISDLLVNDSYLFAGTYDYVNDAYSNLLVINTSDGTLTEAIPLLDGVASSIPTVWAGKVIVGLWNDRGQSYGYQALQVQTGGAKGNFQYKADANMDGYVGASASGPLTVQKPCDYAVLDSAKWTASNFYSIVDCSGLSTTNVSEWTNYVASNRSFSRAHTAIRVRAKSAEATSDFWDTYVGFTNSIGTPAPISSGKYAGNIVFMYDQNGVAQTVTAGPYVQDRYDTTEIKMAYPYLEFDVKDVPIASTTSWSTTYRNVPLQLGNFEGRDVVDWVMVRNYVYPEPKISLGLAQVPAACSTPQLE